MMMEAIQYVEQQFKPLYVIRNEANQPVFFLEFTSPDYSQFESSFIGEDTLYLFEETMTYVENCKQGMHPFDYETFSLLLNTDIWAYMNLIPQKRRDDIPSYYIMNGKILATQFKKDRKVLRDFLQTGKLHSMQHRIKVEELINRYLNEMGAECLMDKIQSYPFECSEYDTRSILGYRLELMRDKALLSIETAYHLQIGTTSLYLVKANDKARCFLSLMKVNEAI
jgi:hypothetical protein